MEADRTVADACDKEGFLTPLGVYGERSVRESVSVGLVDDGDDATRQIYEADWERRAESDVGAHGDGTIGGDLKARAALYRPRADRVDSMIEGRRRVERGHPSTPVKTRNRQVIVERDADGCVTESVGLAAFEQRVEVLTRRSAKPQCHDPLSRPGGRDAPEVMALTFSGSFSGRGLRRSSPSLRDSRRGCG